MSLTTPMLCSEVAGGVTQTIVCLFREPDAGNPPVRFDEREQEPESSPTGLRRRSESQVNSHRETNATAPVLDSTQLTGTPIDSRINRLHLHKPFGRERSLRLFFRMLLEFCRWDRPGDTYCCVAWEETRVRARPWFQSAETRLHL